MSDIAGGLDYREQLARIDRALAETAKLQQKSNKLNAEAAKFYQEGGKFAAETRKLTRDFTLSPVATVAALMGAGAALLGGLLGALTFLARVLGKA